MLIPESPFSFPFELAYYYNLILDLILTNYLFLILIRIKKYFCITGNETIFETKKIKISNNLPPMETYFIGGVFLIVAHTG